MYASYSSIGKTDDNKSYYVCTEIQNLDHRKKVITENNVVCIDLWASWCEPCKIVSPKFAELAQHYNSPGKCLLVKENIDLELTRDYQIRAIPAFIFYKNGQLLRNEDGTPVDVVGGDIQDVKEVLDNLLKSD